MKIFVKPKKKLGQHFLTDNVLAGEIVNFLSFKGRVVEIGPGTGILTKYLLAKQDIQYKGLDIDAASICFLKEKYEKDAEKFFLSDFLKYDIPKEKLAIIGNFPYNISSQILFRIFEHYQYVEEMIGMFQKEVAIRVCAKPNSKAYGILSVLIQAYYDTSYLVDVSSEVFNPPPKVGSAVIKLTRNKTVNLTCDELLFKRIVKTGFGQRRKKLLNALKQLNMSLERIDKGYSDKRAEQMSVQDFIVLTNQISSGNE